MKSPGAVRTIVGLLFILFGAVLFLKWAGYDLPFLIPSSLFTWQLILIILGIYFVASGNRNTGLLMILIGGVFWLRQIYGYTFRDIFTIGIPVLLVLAGLMLIFPQLLRRKKKHRERITDRDPELSAVHVFSGGSRVIESDHFSGGEVVCVFGGADLHFRGSSLAPGKNILHTTCIFGGCDVYVPDDWSVQLEATQVFGEASDKRFRNTVKPAEDPDKTLIIKGFMLFGGLDVKRA